MHKDTACSGGSASGLHCPILLLHIALDIRVPIAVVQDALVGTANTSRGKEISLT